MDGLGPGIDQPRTRPGVARPGGHQTPAQQGDRTGAILLNPTRSEVLSGRAVVARRSIRRQWRSQVKLSRRSRLRGSAFLPVSGGFFPAMSAMPGL